LNHVIRTDSWEGCRPVTPIRVLGPTEAGSSEPLLASQETGANHHQKPLSRVKEDGLNRSLVFFFLLAVTAPFVSVASAADLHVKVVDPHSAAVAGAQVLLYRASESTPLQVRTTAGDGEASFRLDSQAPLRIQVLAPGFAEAWENSQSQSKDTSTIVVRLQLARASETVVVTATRTPVPQEDTAASVSLLSSDQLETMQPVSSSDALRFLPGAVVNVAGQRGGLGSLFVEGGDSRYNKVLVDDVPINDPGGTFNFATIPLAETDRLEFFQGAQSTLYGSDAMTSVVEVFSRNGTTAIPELRFGADGGNFGTAHGFAALSGARSRFDYDAFADQFNTNGQGPNADYTNALQGGNFGVQLNDRVLFRLRVRHSNSRTGVPGEWDFNNQREFIPGTNQLLSPDMDQRARANNFLGSVQLSIAAPNHWQHRLTGYDYNTRRLNEDNIPDQGCDNSQFIFIDCPFTATVHINRAGFMYQGDYTPRTWAQTTIGYEFEDENARLFTESITLDSQAPPFVFTQFIPAIRLNHAAYLQQRVTWKRLTVLGSVRYVHNETFGYKTVPRVGLTFLARKGGEILSGTRLRFSYSTGIKEARFEEAYANGLGIDPNPNLKAEENRAFETGIEQAFFAGKLTLSAMYFNNAFRDQINFVFDPTTHTGQYQNIDHSISHGAEAQATAHFSSRVSLTGGYVYTSTQQLSGTLLGQPLLRRPKHSGSLLLSYLGSRWGANLGGSFVGRRADLDFLGFSIDHAAGYALVKLGGWYAINSRITAYANVENALNQHYNEVVGYPALTANFRAGLRFRIGGD
jgi:vitamin B12 transporter